jgi:hypothetical protein
MRTGFACGDAPLPLRVRVQLRQANSDVARRGGGQGGQMRATATVDAAPQHLRALEAANRVRLARAEMKRRVAGGTLSAAEVILACPSEAEGMAVADLLTSQRRWGHARCRKFLGAFPMSENKTIGSMTDRQRLAVAAKLTARTQAEAAEHVLAPAGFGI